MTETETWVVLHRPTRNIVAEYDTEQEALEAATWYEGTFGGGKLEVQKSALDS